MSAEEVIELFRRYYAAVREGEPHEGEAVTRLRIAAFKGWNGLNGRCPSKGDAWSRVSDYITAASLRRDAETEKGSK